MTLTPMQEKAKLYCEALIAKYDSNIAIPGEDGKYHYIYLSYHKQTYKFYIGKHSSKSFSIDKYTGSGLWYGHALKHHGKDAFEHHRLAFFPTSDEAYAKEAEEVTLEMIENIFKGQIYNLKEGGKGGTKLSKEIRERLAQAKRDGVEYTLNKDGISLEGVTRYELLPLLKEGWKVTSHKVIKLHHAKVAGSTIQVKKETGFMEADILDAFEAFGKENFALGKAPEGHETTADKETVEKVKEYIVSFRKRWRQRSADSQRDSTRYTLKKGDEPPLEDVTRYKLIPLLKEGWKITSHEQIQLHHAKVAGSTIQVSGVYKEADILHALEAFGEKDFALGHAPSGLETTADEKTVKKVKDYIELVRKRGNKRMADSKRDSTRYTLKKGDEPPLEDVTRYEVLGKLNEGYRFTIGSVAICNKAGTVNYRFEQKGANYDREKQHQKLIRLLESGEWQIGSVWEEPLVVEEPAVVGEPVVAEIEELVEANPVVGEPVVQSAWGEMINFFDSFKDLPITRKTRYTI
jgi:hypothetical protein